MATVGIPPRSVQAWDVPAEEVTRQAACDTARKAMAVTHSQSDRIAYANDLYLLDHPEACASTEDYPGFADEVARQEAKNRAARRAS
jgi:hypothetical protein